MENKLSSDTRNNATSLARATVFVVCMNLARLFMRVKGKAKQKGSLTLCVFG